MRQNLRTVLVLELWLKLRYEKLLSGLMKIVEFFSSDEIYSTLSHLIVFPSFFLLDQLCFEGFV